MGDIRNGGKAMHTFAEKGQLFANCCDLHGDGRYLVAGYADTICLFELNMRSCFENITKQYTPQVVAFCKDQSNLSLLAGYNHSDLSIYDRNCAKMNMDCTDIATSIDSVWSAQMDKTRNLTIVCGASASVDLIANATGNTVISLNA